MELTSTDDLLVAAAVVFVALTSFIALLWLNRQSTSGETVYEKVEDAAAEGGTVLVKEEGRVVRRSTRQHKPPAGDDAYPKSPSVPKTPRSARAAGEAPARTPRTEERPTSPARGRRAAAAKSPAPAARRAAKSPARAIAAPASPATTPRRSTRATRA